MNVLELFNLRCGVTSGDLGVEIEVEGNNLPNAAGKYWRVERDGSLVGESNEYVFRAPLSDPDMCKAIDCLSAVFADKGSEVYDTVRCGVHVHVNVQELERNELFNFITLYTMFEWVLLDYCGKGRKGNLFALPINRSPLLVDKLCSVLVKKDYKSLYNDEYRYCAINVKALGEYGSLEFRAMRGGDFNKVKSWASFLLHLRTMAKGFNNPCDIIQCSSMMGLEEFFKHIAGEHYNLFKCYDNKQRKLVDGVRNVLPIVYAIDWEKVEIPYEDFC